MARQADLLPVEVAQQRILDEFERLQAVECLLEDALGRVLARDVYAPLDLPPFPNSSMDGFALRAALTTDASTESPVVFPVSGVIAAGSSEPSVLPPAATLRIMTGAPLPEGADAVVPFEDIDERDGTIAVTAAISVGACVRPRGNDVTRGARVLSDGQEITSRDVGLLAALGRPTVSVTQRPLVAILSTGDELVAPGQSLQPGQIYNSNTPMLAAAITEAGCTPTVITPSRDDPEAIGAALRSISDVDLILTSGGASVGDFDHIRTVIESLGTLDFWRVRVRPGKPMLFGRVNGVSIIGLPGNPTSAMVTFELFVRPALKTMLGAFPFRPRLVALLSDRVNNRGGRRTYARVVLTYTDGTFRASLAGSQDSAMLLPLAHADGLAILHEDREEIASNEPVEVLIWNLPDAEALR